MHAQAVATQLMIELCGATRRARHDRHRRAADAPAQVIRLRERARAARSSACAVPRERQAEILAALDFASASRPTTAST